MLKEHRSRAAFSAHLRQGDYDLLVVGTAGPRDERARGWAEALGFIPVAGGEHFTLLARARGPSR
jgi:hypothetical protein